MRIEKWVDLGANVTIDIDLNDIRGALSEAFTEASKDPLGEASNKHTVLLAFNQIGAFLNGLGDGQIGLLTFGQRMTIESFLRKNADRFKLTPENAPGAFESGAVNG